MKSYRCVAVVKQAWLAITLAILSGCASMADRSADQQGMVMNPEETAQFNAAMVEMEKENYDKGIAMLESLAANSRDTAVLHINMAIAHKKQGDLDAAEQDLEAALNIEPYNPVANNEYGLLLRETGRFSEARAVYEKILKKYPNFALANKNLGVLCDIYLRDYPCALEAYRAYSDAVPEDEKAPMWISDLEWRVKQ